MSVSNFIGNFATIQYKYIYGKSKIGIRKTDIH